MTVIKNHLIPNFNLKYVVLQPEYGDEEYKKFLHHCAHRSW